MSGVPFSTLTAEYPPELTDAAWQRAKGLVGKMTETGLGAELKKAEALWRAIDVSKLDPSSSPSKTLEELEQKVVKSKAHYRETVEPLSKQLAVVKKVAADAAAKLGRAVGGGSAAKAATAVEKRADLLGVTCKSLDLEGAIAKVKADIDKKNELAQRLLEDSLKKFAVGAEVFLRAPSMNSWSANIKQQGRSVSNSVAQLTRLRVKYWAAFEKFKGFDEHTLGLKESDHDTMVNLVKSALEQVKQIARGEH